MTYNPSKRNVYALLKNQAKSDDVLKAAFHVRFLTLLIWCLSMSLVFLLPNCP